MYWTLYWKNLSDFTWDLDVLNEIWLEPFNFMVDSSWWEKKYTKKEEENFLLNLIKYDSFAGYSWLLYKINSLQDIVEIIFENWEKEQLFTWDAMIRETKKAWKRVPTNEEFRYIFHTLKEKYEEIKIIDKLWINLVGSVKFNNFEHVDMNFNQYFWSYDNYGYFFSRRLFFSENCSNYRKDYGFSVRCFKN